MLISEVMEMFVHNRKFKMGASPETIKTYTYALKVFTTYMEDERNRTGYQEITRVDMVAFSEYVKGQLESQAWSLSKYLLVLKTMKAMFRWMEKDDDCREEELRSWRDRLPKGGKVPKRDYIPSPAELRKWKQAFNTKSATGLRNYVMFSVLLGTGIRRGELAGIKVSDLHLDNNLINVDGKTGARLVRFTDQLGTLLRTYLKRRERSFYKDAPYLFPSRTSMDEPTNAQYISQIFRKMKKRLDLPKLTPHTLRHSFCTYYLENGGDLPHLQLQSGHATLESMQHYLHLSKVRGKQATDLMEKASPLKMLATTK